MKLIVFSCTFVILCLGASQGRPSSPVFRVFFTPQDNPNVRVFSTYPTEQPLVKDNPNDLEKSDDDKYLKDQSEDDTLKGELIPKAESEDPSTVDIESSNVEEELSMNEENLSPVEEDPSMTDANLSISMSEDTLPSEDMSSKLEGDSSTVDLEDVDSSFDDVDAKPEDPADSEPSTDNNSKALIQGERTSPNLGSLVEMKEDPIADDETMVMSDPILPTSEPEIVPIGIEAPANVLPPLVESNDQEGEMNENLENTEDEPDIFISLEPNFDVDLSESLDQLFMNPESKDESSNMDEAMPPIAEEDMSTVPMSETDSALVSESVNTHASADESETMKPVAVVTEEREDPMAGLSDGVLQPLEPKAEMNLDESFVEETEEVTTHATDIGNAESMMGELGVALGNLDMDKITPTVEAEVSLGEMDETLSEVEEKMSNMDVMENPDMQNEKVSLKITASEEPTDFETTEQNYIVTENEQETITTTEESVPMAGFMSDESKSMTTNSPIQKDEAEMVPSTTDLTFILSFDEMSTERPETTTQADLVDTLEASTESIISAMEEKATSEDSEATTPEPVPEVDPVELALQEDQHTNSDPTLNETV